MHARSLTGARPRGAHATGSPERYIGVESLSQVKQNIRVRFSKQGDIRFTSHHDLMRLFERALRRADLPVAASEGHNPRPRLSFPMALSVGHTGLNEVADVGLSEWVRPEEFRGRLQAQLPPGLKVNAAQATQINPRRQPTELSYRVPLCDGHSLTAQAVDELLSKDEAVVTRVRKDQVRQLDVRQYVKALRFDGECVEMLLSYTQEGTAKPEEVMEALGCREGTDYRQGRIERTYVNVSLAN